MRSLFTLALIAFLLSLTAGRSRSEMRPLPSECTYEIQVWNVNLKKSIGPTKVRHPYSELAPEETDPLTGCTVCSEDQVRIDTQPLPSFSVCYKIAPRIRLVLEDLMRNGAPLFSVEGYRVIKSRGQLDPSGNRTEFSNHSFGTAIDINSEQNGLYDNCVTFGPECRLLRGGEWRPGTPGALEKSNEIVLSLQQEGFRWGGEIAGRQKDFMHFSLTGY